MWSMIIPAAGYVRRRVRATGEEEETEGRMDGALVLSLRLRSVLLQTY